MSARKPPSEALLAMLEALTDGSWQPGMRILGIGERAVPSWQASRTGMARRKIQGLDIEEYIKTGRRHLTRGVVREAAQRGTLEIDVPVLTRDHYNGALPWRVRDPNVGLRSVLQAAEELDVPEHVLRTWIRKGYVPTTTARNLTRFSPADFAIAEKVRAAWPGLHKMNWPIDPRTLWQDTAAGPGLTCPHCGEALSVVVGRG